MKHISGITSVLSKVELPNRDLEDVINHRLRKDKYRFRLNGLDLNSFSSGFETIQTVSTKISVKGNLEICVSKDCLRKKEIVEVPVQSTFLVTCIKGNDCMYKVATSMSLS